jgi:hypothetical protein
MKLKLTKDGTAVVRNGFPVYITGDGSEREIDGAAAMKLALSKHFEASPTMARLNIPADVAAAFFGDKFHIEGGKLVALDKHGLKMYSHTRHGEVANFDEAFGQFVDSYQNKSMILREPGSAGSAPSGNPGNGGNLITRAAFDAMPPIQRANFINGGGRIGEDSAAAPAAPPSPPAGSKAISRAQFDVMGPRDRAAHFKNGGKVID